MQKDKFIKKCLNEGKQHEERLNECKDECLYLQVGYILRKHVIDTSVMMNLVIEIYQEGVIQNTHHNFITIYTWCVTHAHSIIEK